MAKKNDVDLQTFVIYQDDETNDHPAEDATPKKKKFGMPSFKKKEKIENAVDSDDHEVDAPSDAISVNNGGNKSSIIKGLAIGLILLIIIVVIDQLRS